MKFKLFGLLLLILILAFSCKSDPAAVPAEQPSSSPVRVAAPASDTAESFDPGRVTQQHYTSTMEEVQVFINDLNRIIASKDYRAWRARLSPEYLAEISSPAFLHQVSEQPAMKTRRIVLRSAEEYFIHVVVPSRANSRVDNIEFVGMNKVIAYTVNTNRAGEEVRLRLYDLEKINNSWIIIN